MKSERQGKKICIIRRGSKESMDSCFETGLKKIGAKMIKGCKEKASMTFFEI